MAKLLIITAWEVPDEVFETVLAELATSTSHVAMGLLSDAYLKIHHEFPAAYLGAALGTKHEMEGDPTCPMFDTSMN